MSQTHAIQTDKPPPAEQNNMKFMQLIQLIQRIQAICTKSPLDKYAGVKDNNATTKLIAAKPSRHTLAIFMPDLIAQLATGVNILSLLDNYRLSQVYGGLIGVNIRPFTGNSPSRLLAVVETRHPLQGLAKLTKLIGVFTMKTSPILSHSLAVLTAEYERLNRLHEYDPYAGYADRANAIYNAIHALKIHASTQDKAITPPRQQNAIQRILGALFN